jgi:hypothetical protein
MGTYGWYENRESRTNLSIAYLTSFQQNECIHCGGKDIGLKTSAAIIADLKIIIDNIRNKFPYTKLIWSHNLPRRYHADRARKRIKQLYSHLCNKLRAT